MKISKIISGQTGVSERTPMTLLELKSVLNTLSEEVLNQPVRYWGECEGGFVYSVSEATDDLINPSGDGLEAKSLYSTSDVPEDIETANEESVVVPVGSILFDV